MPALLWPDSVWGSGPVLSSAIAGGILVAQQAQPTPGDLTLQQWFPASLALLPGNPAQQQRVGPNLYRSGSNLFLSVGNVADFGGTLLDDTTTNVTFTITNVKTGTVLYQHTRTTNALPGYWSVGVVDASTVSDHVPILVSAQAFYVVAPELYATVDREYWPVAPLRLTFARASLNRLQVSFPDGAPSDPMHVVLTITDGAGVALVRAVALTQVAANLWQYDVPASAAAIGAVWYVTVDYTNVGVGPSTKGRITAVATDGG